MKNGLDKAQMAQIEFIQALTTKRISIYKVYTSFDGTEGQLR